MSDAVVAAIVGGLVGGAVACTIGWFSGYSWGREYMERYIKYSGISLNEPKPQTNADRIRQMSDEELAELLAMACPIGFQGCDSVEMFTDESAEHHCARCLLPWLKSPVKDGDSDV